MNLARCWAKAVSLSRCCSNSSDILCFNDAVSSSETVTRYIHTCSLRCWYRLMHKWQICLLTVNVLSMVGGQKQLHIWNPGPQFNYLLWHFYRASMKNKGCLLLRLLMLKAKSNKKFPSKTAKFWRFSESNGQGVQKFLIFYCKRHICTWIHVTYAMVGSGTKSKESDKDRIFHIFPRSPHSSDCHQIWFEGRFPDVINWANFIPSSSSSSSGLSANFNKLKALALGESVQGFWFCNGLKSGLSHRNEVSPLTR